MALRIFGRGYIGTFLGEALGIEPEDFRVARIDPADTVINCVGKTGRPNIDACEDDILGTYEANVAVPLEIARRCRHMIHLSSGCLFDGYPREGFRENDLPNLLSSTYCWTKWQAERLLQQSTIVRLRMPLSDTPNPRNLITKVRRYTQVIDQQNSVTYLPDLVPIIQRMLLQMPEGIFHVTSPDTISPAQLNCSATPVKSLEGLTRVPRSNCRLNVGKVERLMGRPLPPLRPRLRMILAAYQAAEFSAGSATCAPKVGAPSTSG